MCDATHERSVLSAPRPQTPAPDGARKLHRTISYASIATVRPSNSKGVRRRINDIAESLKSKSTRLKKKQPGTQGVPKYDAARDQGPDPAAASATKSAERGRTGRKAAAPLRESSQKPTNGQGEVLVAADKLHSGTPSEQDTPSTVLTCAPDALANETLPTEGDRPQEVDLFTDWSLDPVATGGQGTFQPPRTSTIGIDDVQFDIQPSQADVTIWDGLRVTYHVFQCRLFLRCTTHPYDSVSLLDIPRFEMRCDTHPLAGTRYARPPVVQTTYKGASPGLVATSDGLPSLRLAAGIHVDRTWRKVREEDGTWGWCRDAYIPLSPRLFDKIDYRRFKLVSRVWLGERCVESESTFGVSMLLREVEMT